MDILVNSARFGLVGSFPENALERELSMIRVNKIAVVILTKLFLNDMLNRGNGKILNVASTAAFLPGPLMAVYYATKAHVLSFGEALAHELAGTGVTVTTLCPGPTKTQFQERADQKGTRLVEVGVMAPDKVARIGYKGLMQGGKVVIPGFLNKTAAWFSR